MLSIGGNTYGILQKQVSKKSDIGSIKNTWEDITVLKGWLDYTSGDSSYKNNYTGKVEETTHIFICDYATITTEPSLCRIVIDNKVYDVLHIDDPMNKHYQLEIYLKLNGVISK